MVKNKHFHVAKLYAFKELVCHLQQAVTVLCAVVTDDHKNYLSSVFSREKLECIDIRVHKLQDQKRANDKAFPTSIIRSV